VRGVRGTQSRMWFPPLHVVAVVPVIVAFYLVAGAAELQRKQTAPKPNVLFIIMEDLRPELQNYGRDHVHTPNILRIAQHGVTFDLCLCQVSVCAPSRASLLTGLVLVVVF
jgi:iduronate 2-sulfatase